MIANRNSELKNVKLLVDLTAKGLGCTIKRFRSLPAIASAGGEHAKLKAAIKLVHDFVPFSNNIMAFTPSVCQEPMTDLKAIAMYDEFPDAYHQILFAGGKAGTIWSKVPAGCMLNVFPLPYSVVGFCVFGGFAVVRQSYVDYIRQFLPNGCPLPEDVFR